MTFGGRGVVGWKLILKNYSTETHVAQTTVFQHLLHIGKLKTFKKWLFANLSGQIFNNRPPFFTNHSTSLQEIEHQINKRNTKRTTTEQQQKTQNQVSQSLSHCIQPLSITTIDE